MIPKHTVIRYLRDKNRVPYGVLVAVKHRSGYLMGYSQCKRGDKFSKEMALRIAVGRAMENSWPASHMLPREVYRAMGDFITRCNKYYKAEQVDPGIDDLPF
jgi:hypothetical protein